ncbi:MAG TPA: ROK family protein [Hyphomicrobiaceae bacterium]|nr:ROK family protein [Hyphomicrobiaceae bacterium]
MANKAPSSPCRIGIDLGGSKIAGIAIGEAGVVLASRRMAAPQHDYAATLRAIAEMVGALEQSAGRPGTVGIGMPGSIAPGGGGVQNANSTWLNGQPFTSDLEQCLAKPVRLANDANCFALSEAVDGAGTGARSLFGVILGTGCGGGLVFEGKLIDGPRGTGGEWGHNPLPWADPGEQPGPPCWCGRRGCMEKWVSGPGLERDHFEQTGVALAATAIAASAAAGTTEARASLARHASRLARGLAHVVNIFDPEIVVLGGGLSQLEHLYRQLPPLMAAYILARDTRVVVKPPRWGDASGVRGAARLWP